MVGKSRPGWTLEQIDRELAEWQSRLNLASNNLLELDDLFTFKRLKAAAESKNSQLTGLTQVRVAPALAAVGDLWRYLKLLSDVVAKAIDLRKAIPRFWVQESALNDIAEILHGQSIQMPSISMPLAQRGLLSAAEHTETTSPDQLLAAMTEVFGTTKAAILDVDEAWKRLDPLMESAQSQVTALQGIADRLGEGALPELAAVGQKLNALRSWIESDPLGVHLDFTREINPFLEQTRARLKEVQQAREQIQSDLERARFLMAQLRDVHTRAEAAQKECRDNLEGIAPLPPILPGANIDDLAQWLDTLEANMRQGNWKSVRIGIERWTKSHQTYLDAEQSAFSTANTLLETRAELRGRLASLRVKADSCTARGIVLDPGLPSIAAEAEQLLQRKPTPLTRAQERVTEYEARLNRCLTQRPKP